jgi:sirohydrochlorin ferrochelatase
MTALVLFAHGSPIRSANDAVRAVAEEARRLLGFDRAGVAFLEPYPPSLAAAVADLAAAGATRVVVVPYFLTLGLHLQRDIPSIAAETARLHPGVELCVSAPLDGHPALAGIVADRARAALAECRQPASGQS